jgi:hypothetical protein
MVNIEDALSKKIKNILKKDEIKVNIIELIDVTNELLFFESNGFSSIDKEKKDKLLNILEYKLKQHVEWLFDNRSKLGEKQFNLHVVKLEKFRLLLDKTDQEKINQIVPSNKKENKSFFSQPPKDYKFWLVMWTGTVIFLSFLSFCIIHLVINRIKKNNSKKQ